MKDVLRKEGEEEEWWKWSPRRRGRVESWEKTDDDAAFGYVRDLRSSFQRGVGFGLIL